MSDGGLSASDFEPGMIVRVLPDQSLSDDFLNTEVAQDGEAYRLGDGLSFDPKNPKITGKIFIVKETEPYLEFSEPFPEDMYGDYHTYYPFIVNIYPPLNDQS